MYTCLQFGFTALIKACSKGQTDMVDLLLQRKANTNMQTRVGNPLPVRPGALAFGEGRR